MQRPSLPSIPASNIHEGGAIGRPRSASQDLRAGGGAAMYSWVVCDRAKYLHDLCTPSEAAVVHMSLFSRQETWWGQGLELFCRCDRAGGARSGNPTFVGWEKG